MRPSTVRGFLCIAGLGLILLGAHMGKADRNAGDSNTGPGRLLGPFADLAKDITWIAAQRAIVAGEESRAILLAERAVSLDPRDGFGWERYGTLVGTLLASPASEEDPAVRLAWVRAALEIFERGQERCDSPASLARIRAFYLLTRAQSDPELPWPGGPSEPWELAAEAFEASARLYSDSEDRAQVLLLAREARAAAEDLR